MEKPNSGLFHGSEPLDDVKYRASKDDDKTDSLLGDKKDDDSTDSDKTDTDATDKGDSGDDRRDTDGKD